MLNLLHLLISCPLYLYLNTTPVNVKQTIYNNGVNTSYYLNTTPVNVKQNDIHKISMVPNNLNTTPVNVKLKVVTFKDIDMVQFKYNSC